MDFSFVTLPVQFHLCICFYSVRLMQENWPVTPQNATIIPTFSKERNVWVFEVNEHSVIKLNRIYCFRDLLLIQLWSVVAFLVSYF